MLPYNKSTSNFRKTVARERYPDISQKESSTGLALSGGGVRSASFSTGLLVGLYRNKILQRVDVISSVSGGGYVPLQIAALSQAKDANEPQTPNLDYYFYRNNLYEEILKNTNGFNSTKRWLLLRVIRGIGYGVALSLLILLWVRMFYDQFAKISPNMFSQMTKAIREVLNYASFTLISVSLFIVVFYVKWRRHRKETGREEAVREIELSTFITAILFVFTYIVISLGSFASLALIFLLVLLYFLKEQLNPSNSPRIFILRSVVSAVLGKWKTPINASIVTLACLCVIELSKPLLNAIGNFLFSYVLQIAPSYPVETGIILLIILFFITIVLFARQSNYASLFNTYKSYLNEMLLNPHIAESSKKCIGDFKNACSNLKINEPKEKISDYQKHPTWFPECVANIGVASDDHFIHGAITAAGLVIGKRTFSWENISNDDLYLSEYDSAMTLSGAAVDSRVSKNIYVKFLISFFGMTTGLWVKNPIEDKVGNLKMRLVTDFFGMFDPDFYGIKRTNLRLSDGGHFENTGVYYLMTIRTELIICGDASYDPLKTGDSLRILAKYVRINLGIDLVFTEQSDGLLMASFSYDDGSSGRIYYLRHDSVDFPSQNWGKNISASFPHDSTNNQFLSPDVFDCYYHCGLLAANSIANCVQSEFKILEEISI